MSKNRVTCVHGEGGRAMGSTGKPFKGGYSWSRSRSGNWQDNMTSVLALIEALKNPDTSVRWRAATALGKRGDFRAVSPLCKRLKDGNERVRKRAAEALGNIGNARAVWSLCKALEDGDGTVRRKAAEALGKIAQQNPVSELTSVLPLLQQLWQSEKNKAVKQTYRIALRHIEEAIASLMLPRPSAAPLPLPETLPIPVTTSETDADKLPIPADAPESSDEEARHVKG